MVLIQFLNDTMLEETANLFHGKEKKKKEKPQKLG